MEWKTVKLGEVCKKVCSGGTPSSRHSEYYDGDIPWLNTKEINFNRIFSTEKCITKEGLANSSAKWIEENAVIVAMYGATAGKSAINKIPLTTNQACCNLIIESSKADYRYIYYTLTNRYFELASLANGGAQQNLNAQIIKDFEISLPPLETQRQIAEILSSLDDKIENNNRINRNLEAQAQALFKSWFVDFEPFKNGGCVESELGLIPKGWKIVSLSDLMSYNGGSQPPASEFIEQPKEGYVRFIQIRDYASDSHITYIPISKKNKLCDIKDIMIARYGASLGRICYGLKGAYNVALAKVSPKKNYYREYLRCYLNSREFYEGINKKGNRAVQAGFNNSDIQSFKLPVPVDEGIIMEYEKISSSLFEKRLLNQHESQRLAALRDTLLPKLMKGEIAV